MKNYQWLRTFIATLAAVVALTSTNLSFADNPRVALVTHFGTIELELLPDLAPRTVSNFLTLVDEKFYDGLVFHRVIANFMIQGGGYTPDLQYKPIENSVPNESFNGVKNRRGTVAMARLSDPDSANSQFFINVRDNTNLDADGNKAGYTVFARVSAGMEVVDKIELVNTHLKKGMAAVPEEPVIIVSIERL
jgi:cyclophilin family peptidyl-prolyl cis-trans isomerase